MRQAAVPVGGASGLQAAHHPSQELVLLGLGPLLFWGHPGEGAPWKGGRGCVLRKLT